MANKHWEQNKDATVYAGNLDERFGEGLMWELMTQMGPVLNVHMPMDRISRTHQGYGFVEFDTTESADYAALCLNGVRLFGKPMRVNKASADKQRAAEIGAELFINNLDQQVDEKVLYDTFSRFGQLVSPPNVVRDQNHVSKGYGFVNFDSFDASDAARDAMNGQYLLSKQVTVEYAYKKDGKGDRHGDDAERKLASEGKKRNIVPEHQPLPPAYLMNGSSADADVATPAAGAAAGGAPKPAGGGPPTSPALAKPGGGFPQHLPPQHLQQQQQQQVPPHHRPRLNGMPAGPQAMMVPGVPPRMPPPGFGAGGGRMSQPQHPPPGFGSGMPPPLAAGLPALPGRPSGLPPPPLAGLPARPPPSQGGFNGPADFYPGAGPGGGGFRGGPHPPAIGAGAGVPPPQGFAAAPPPGFPGAMAMAPPPPPGFMPPPGYGGPPPPGQPQAPAGFGRR